VELRRVESPAAAAEGRFLSSPTVRIDGVDVEPGGALRDEFGPEVPAVQDERGPARSTVR
jgi:hypothetical protein